MTAMDGIIRGKSPCKGCKERFAACQDRFPVEQRGGYGYPSWKAELERVKKNIREYKSKPFSKIM